jgi:hypothetical protein
MCFTGKNNNKQTMKIKTEIFTTQQTEEDEKTKRITIKTESLKSTLRKSKPKKVCFKISFKYDHSFSPPRVLWQAIPEAEGIITKGGPFMCLGPRFWDS